MSLLFQKKMNQGRGKKYKKENLSRIRINDNGYKNTDKDNQSRDVPNVFVGHYDIMRFYGDLKVSYKLCV